MKSVQYRRKSKKILVIYTGGTFGMSESLEIPNLSGPELKARLEQGVPEMKRIAKCDVRIAFNTDSCQMGLTHWLTLASMIRAGSKNYDGAVVLHGTDTLAYTASALSYLLGQSAIPVVLTGAQKPLSALRNDARGNLLTALEVAANPPRELKNRVMVAFHDELFLGTRVRKLSALRFGAFESPRFPILAKVGGLIQYRNSIFHLPKLPASGNGRALLNAASKPANTRGGALILKLEVTPEFPGQIFDLKLLQSLDGVLLTLFTSGTAPTENPSFLQFLRSAKKASVPVFAITEREDAPMNLNAYAAGKTLVREGVLWCHDLTPEAAFSKAQVLHLQKRIQGGMEKKQYLSWLKGNWSRNLSDESSS
ncbi:MAG: asparaginase [Bdellovibrionales bacterium]|nr:asparaginase [Bdellovibrionales bacterium]